jgi:hypothetical protein
VNLYEYVRGNPVNRRDAFGLMATGNEVDPGNGSEIITRQDCYNYCQETFDSQHLSQSKRGNPLQQDYNNCRKMCENTYPEKPPEPPKPTPIPLLTDICDQYPSCEECPIDQCKKESEVLFNRYKDGLQDWVMNVVDKGSDLDYGKSIWGKHYIHCTDYADKILSMGLTSNLSCFYLQKGTDSVSHNWVDVIHICNGSGNSDAILDPWSFGNIWGRSNPVVKPGRIIQ